MPFEPIRLDESIHYGCRLLGIEALTQGVSSDVHERHVILPICSKPEQRASSMGVSSADADLPQGSSTVRPLFADLVERADDAALEDRPEAFDCLSVHGTDDVFACGVVNRSGARRAQSAAHY